MPKQTFFDLSNKKQLSVINAAYDEFLEHPYKNASIARIARGAGISVGSFYQYFEDKYDLVQYLCTLIIDRFATSHDMSYWQLLDYETAQSLGLTERDYTFLFEATNRFPIEVQNRLFFDTLDTDYIRHTRRQLAYLMAQGKLKPKLDLDFISYLLSAAPLIVQEYGERKGFSKEERFAYNRILTDVIYSGILLSERSNLDGRQEQNKV